VDFVAVGKRIKEVRERCGLTQEELSEEIDISSSHMSVIERGKKGPRLETLVNIANALGVSADELLQDVVDHSQVCVANELTMQIMALPYERRTKIINVLNTLLE